MSSWIDFKLVSKSKDGKEQEISLLGLRVDVDTFSDYLKDCLPYSSEWVELDTFYLLNCIQDDINTNTTYNKELEDRLNVYKQMSGDEVLTKIDDLIHDIHMSKSYITTLLNYQSKIELLNDIVDEEYTVENKSILYKNS